MKILKSMLTAIWTTLMPTEMELRLDKQKREQLLLFLMAGVSMR